MKNPFLLGQTVFLRPLEIGDAPAIVPWVNDPEVLRNLRLHRPMNVRAEEEFITKLYQSDSDVALGIVVKSSDRFIGVAGLHHIDYKNRHAGFGIFIGEKDEWGKGYGTETTRLLVEYAFATLNLNRVWLHVFEDNPRGEKAYLKAGFKREGVLRQDSYRNGRYWDTIVMGILREEWDAPATPR